MFLYLNKIILGLMLAAPLGPVNTEMIRQGLLGGFWHSFNVRVGGCLGNLICLLLAYGGLSSVASNPQLVNTLGLLGSLFLMIWGGKILLSSTYQEAQKNSLYDPKEALKVGFILAVANPIGLTFWLGTFASTATQSEAVLTWYSFLENTLIILGVLLWGACLSFTLSHFKHFFRASMINTATKIAGLFIILYGANNGYHILITY